MAMSLDDKLLMQEHAEVMLQQCRQITVALAGWKGAKRGRSKEAKAYRIIMECEKLEDVMHKAALL